jgi:hypothetical protein
VPGTRATVIFCLGHDQFVLKWIILAKPLVRRMISSNSLQLLPDPALDRQARGRELQVDPLADAVMVGPLPATAEKARDVLAISECQRHDRENRIETAVGDVKRGVRHEKVLMSPNSTV